MNKEKFYKHIDQDISLQYEIAASPKKYVFGIFDKCQKLELVFSDKEKAGSMLDLSEYDHIKRCRLHVKLLECSLPIGYLKEDVWKHGCGGKNIVKGTLVINRHLDGWWKDKYGNTFLDKYVTTQKEN